MTTQYIGYPSSSMSPFWGAAVANFAALPATGTIGEVRQTLSDRELWTWDGATWSSIQPPDAFVEYKGTWNATTNTPTLANGTGNVGDFYITTVAGTADFGAGPITFAVGDWPMYNGTIWQKVINSNAVISVNGYTGAVVLTVTDISGAVSLTGVQTLTNKTLTAPVITDANLTIHDTSSAFTLALRSTASNPLTVNRTFTFATDDRNTLFETLGDISLGGGFTTNDAISLVATTPTTLTLPASGTGTVATLAGTETFTNKTLGTSNTVALLDTLFELRDNLDTSKRINFDATNVPTSTTIVLGVPNASTTLVGTNTSQTLTNKTIDGASNTITNVSLATGVTGVLPIANGGTGQTTANAALNALLPSQTSNSGKALTTNGTTTAWSSVVSNPMTTTGDIIYSSDNSGTPARLAGATGVLHGQAGTAPSWSAVVGSNIDTNTITESNIAVGTLTNTSINASAAIAGSKIVSASGSVSGVVTTGTQELAGAKDFSTAGNRMKGGTDGANQAAGYIGEFLVSKVGSSDASNGSSSPFRVTSISLTAGRWFVWATLQNIKVASQTETFIYVSTTDASSSGTTVGYSASQFSIGAIGNAGIITLNLGPIDQSVSGTTTLYLNAGQTGGTMSSASWKGTLYAIRIG